MIEDEQSLQGGRDYASELDMGDQERQRLAKLNEIRQLNLDPYPPRSYRTHTAREAVAVYEEWEAGREGRGVERWR